MTKHRSHDAVRQEMDSNSPPVVVGQYWKVIDKRNRVLRRVRIVAAYPFDTGYSDDQRKWVIENQQSAMNKMDLRSMNTILEFNLRFAFEPEEIEVKS